MSICSRARRSKSLGASFIYSCTEYPISVAAAKLDRMADRTVLVTGAAGFIGSHAAEALGACGYRIIGVDNFCDFYDRRWKEANLKTSKIDVEEMDITDGA